MEQIVWTDDFSVGIKEIDEQHKMLISMINKLIISSNISMQPEIITDTLTNMTLYAQAHFKTEEHYLSKFNYPNYTKHQQGHETFLEKIVELCLNDNGAKVNLSNELLSFLKNWLLDHILKSDMEYKAFLIEKGEL